MSRLFYHVMQDNVGNLLFDVIRHHAHGGHWHAGDDLRGRGLTVILAEPHDQSSLVLAPLNVSSAPGTMTSIWPKVATPSKP